MMFALTFLHFIQQVPHWSHSIGLAFWGGIGSCLSYLGPTLAIGAMIWHHLNCHEPKCKRIGRFRLDANGRHWLVCHTHHIDNKGGQIADLFIRHLNGGSSNSRTGGFEPPNLGANPSPPSTSDE